MLSRWNYCTEKQHSKKVLPFSTRESGNYASHSQCIRSTIDRIATLNSTRRKFSQPLWVAYVDPKAAFNSVDRSAPWQLWSTHWIIGALGVSWTYIGWNLSTMTRYTPGQPLLSNTVRSCCLSFIWHLYRANPSQNHHWALQACIADPSDNWKWRIGRPRQSWLRTMEADLRPTNLGLATAKRRAQDRSAWWKLVAMAISSQRCSWRKECSRYTRNN